MGTRHGFISLAQIPAHVSAATETYPLQPYVYFASDSATGLVKIGYSYQSRLMGRLREIERQIGRPLTLLATMKGGRALETELHRTLHDDFDHGEWYSPSSALLAIVRTARGEPADPYAAYSYGCETVS